MRIKTALLLLVCFPLTAIAAEKPAPIRALMVTGGCCHDYEQQKKILSEGIAQRANVEWTIVHEGGSSLDHKVSIYKNKDWAKGYDVVVHNECFADVKDVEFIHAITEAHKQGVPAVMIHCAMHCYRGETDQWFELCGVTSRGHGPKHPITVEMIERAHPILKGFPGQWVTPQGELYNIAKVWPNATPLAKGYRNDPAQTQVCIWTNQFGQARVFGTTIGHHNETMQTEQYLDLVSRGLLWACDKLDDDGQPRAGYEGTGVEPRAAQEKAQGPQPTLARPEAEAKSAASQDWSQSQIARLPASEKPVPLFNGKDFTGWHGHTGKYFFIEDGEIVARNTKANAPKVSTYLLTDKDYRNHRLIFEAKLVESEMHSGIALWGEQFEKGGEKFSYRGHLVMFPSGYGYFDLFRRNSIYRDDGTAKAAGKQHDWNRMEILAIGNRIRHVVNGKLVADWSDPKPELCGEGPLGLQLHSNRVPQEVRFRGLILTENPEDVLVTVEK